jgi:phenylacetate-CoA ligase
MPVGWIPFRVIAGRDYRRTFKRGAKLDCASHEVVLAFQESALGRTLKFVTDQVPAYQSLRSTVDRLHPFEAIRAFPFIDKATIQTDIKKYLPRDFDRIPYHEITTGGTSGNQLTLYADNNWHAIELAFIHRQWKRIGYNTRNSKATFRGVNFDRIKKDCYWQRNPIYREWQYSPFHINATTLPYYVRHLQQWRPSYLHGYPSAISMLASFVISESISPESFGIRGVLLGSEGIMPGQREQIEEAFRARVYSWYGHSERLILGGECEKSSAYHMFPDYGFMEFIDDDRNTLKNEGDVGELVGTSFWNYSLPLVRYRTEDYARKLGNRCPCGRNHDLFDQVQGRWKQEYIVGKNGSKMSMAALNMHGSMFDNVVRYQYYQCEPGKLELRVMPKTNFGPQDEKLLIKAFRDKVGDELIVNVCQIENIPLTSRGKIKRLIRDFPIQ